jgi:sugar lactone lactonase YvrE
MAPQVAAAWYVTYLLCLWDVETLVLIVPPGGETLALRVFNLLHYGHNPQINALCLALLGLAALPLALWRLGRWLQLKVSGKDSAIVTGMRWRVCLFSFLSILGLSGCSSRSSSDMAPLNSPLFSRVQVIGSRGTGLGQFNKPRSVAMDCHDHLYVVDMTGRVQKFDANGMFLCHWQMDPTDLGKPKGMECDAAGNVVVIEPHYSRVNHFTPEGKLLLQWGQRGTNSGQLSFPRAVAMNSRGEMFVSEYGRVERVQRFSAEGKQWLSSFGRAGRGPGEFNRAEGLGTDARDRIFVADSCNHRIQVFTPEGHWLRAYGGAGSGLGQLSYPYDVRVDSGGWQFVCEFGNSRIQVFDPQHRPVEVIGGPGSGPGQFSNPWGLTLDSAGNLYVADSGNNRVQKLIRKR